MSGAVTAILQSRFPDLPDTGIRIERLSLLGVADAHLQQFDQAEQFLRAASAECSRRERPECALTSRARASLALEHGQYDEAFRLYSQSLSVERTFHEPFDTAVDLANIGVIYLFEERFDEAIDWLRSSDDVARRLGAEDILLNNAGNLGWAYYKLGDPARALALYREAERRAIELGDVDDTISWLTDSGYVLQDSHEPAQATSSYQEALRLALSIHSTKKVIDSLESLAQISVDTGQPDEAFRYLQQLHPLIRANGNHLDLLYVTLAEARIAALRHQDQQAESLFRSVDTDPTSQVTLRLAAQHALASLYEQQGRLDAAKAEYATALTTFESERAQLKSEESQLPFFANATPIYDDYIHLLVQQGQVTEALAAADQSRARTLAQGLGVPARISGPVPPVAIARSAGATLLFYWLGEKQSYLWVITPQTTSVFSLPARNAIAPLIERYRQTLLGPEDPAGNPDGQALYRILVAPAAGLLRPDGRVVILSDGVLSQLNFETLIVPGPSPHYFIEDADILSAPSLHMLASAKHGAFATRRLLLLGDAVSRDPDYPQLPNARVEMQEIRRHFPAESQTVFAGEHATPAAYIASGPSQFSDIDFVAHGVASRTDPLDSAIILSSAERGQPGGPAAGPTPDPSSGNTLSSDTFKLYAREIIQHPIQARLVTISACSGSGERSYAGEGLVGLSWAFLRAGAHNVIGALWEVSDDSTPRLMDSLYRGLEEGLPPSTALRQAKLALLHSQSAFHRPFYWAPFQLYTGL